MEINITFDGFYNSLWSDLVDRETEQTAEYDANERQGENDIPAELLHVLNRTLEKGPEERYQTINDMLIDLRRLKRDSTKVSRQFLNELNEMQDFTGPVKKSHPQNTTKKRLFYLSSVLIFVIIILILWFFNKKLFKSQPVIKVDQENSIAVMYFENRTGEKDLEKILVKWDVL